MKICIANYQPDRSGGGWSFARNFVKGMGDLITDYNKAEIYFIASASMVELKTVEEAKKDGKKIVLRVDNATRNSRNKRNGMDRMRSKAQLADVVIYQSMWARNYLKDFLGKDGEVIHNSVDESIFNNQGRSKQNKIIYLYSRVNRDETKGFEMSRYKYSLLAGDNTELWIVGSYSPEIVENNFDFYNGEQFKFWGEQPIEQMAQIYKQTDHLLFSFFNDANSNTAIEALCSGVNLINVNGMANTGGTPEIIKNFNKYGAKYFNLDRMIGEYKKCLQAID